MPYVEILCLNDRELGGANAHTSNSNKSDTNATSDQLVNY